MDIQPDLNLFLKILGMSLSEQSKFAAETLGISEDGFTELIKEYQRNPNMSDENLEKLVNVLKKDQG